MNDSERDVVNHHTNTAEDTGVQDRVKEVSVSRKVQPTGRRSLVVLLLVGGACMAFAAGFITNTIVARPDPCFNGSAEVQRLAAGGNNSVAEALVQDVQQMENKDQPPCGGWSLPPFPGTVPSINTTETAKEIKITATLQSLQPEDISVRIQDNALVLSAKQEVPDISRSGDEDRGESSLSSFQAAIPLPTKVNPHQMRKTVENGVLVVVIPKAS